LRVLHDIAKQGPTLYLIEFICNIYFGIAGQEMPIRPERGLREAGLGNQSCNVLELHKKNMKKN